MICACACICSTVSALFCLLQAKNDLFMKCLAAHIARAFLLTATIFCRLVGIDKGYKRSEFRSIRTTYKWVFKSQNIGYSSPTLDCLFESNATFTDWNETCARWKAWGHESLGQLVENSESLVFEFWALKVDLFQCLTPNNLLTDSPIFLKNIINCKYGPKVSLGTIFNPIGEGHLLSISIFVHQTTSTDPFPALISPRVLHAAHSYLAQICTFLTPIDFIKSAPVWCELIELLRFYWFPALISIGCNVKLMTRFRQTPCPIPLNNNIYLCRR